MARRVPDMRIAALAALVVGMLLIGGCGDASGANGSAPQGGTGNTNGSTATTVNVTISS